MEVLKKGKKGGKKEKVAAAAEEQPQREEDRSHALAVARRAIFEFGVGLNEPASEEVRPSEDQAGPSDPRLVRGSRAGGRGRVVLSPVRKRRRDEDDVEDSVPAPEAYVTASELLAATGFPYPREPEKRYGVTPAGEAWSAGMGALQRLGGLYMARPRGQSGKGGPLNRDDRAVESFRQIEESFDRLHDLSGGEEVRRRIRELEKLVDSQEKELGKVRRLLQVAKGRWERREAGLASRDSRAASLVGRPEAQVSAPKVAQAGEWVRVGRGGKPAREAVQRVQLLGGVVNPPPGMVAAAKPGQGGAARSGPPARQGGNAVGGAPKRKKAAAVATPQQSKRAARPRLPRNPAVLMTAVGERSYASLLREAEEKVDLLDIGIEVGAKGGGLLVKRARNGGYLFEVPGKDGAAKADRLARELGEVLVGGAKVARPVKFAEMRVTGLVDGVTPETVVAAFIKCGECSRDDLTVGEIRRSPGGLGAMWVRCPLAAALKVEARKGLRLGWTLAGVQLLEARPLQCYRCLKFGHLAAACTGPTDRKGRCFRCGGDGHLAKGCSADPRCLLCEKAGVDPGHRLGGRACPAAKAAWAKKRGDRPDVRPEGTPGRSRGGGARKAQAAPAPAGGAMGPGAVFRVPDRPALRVGGKEGGAKARAPLAPVRAEAPPREAEGAGDDAWDDVPCTQPPSGREEYSARMEIAEEEEVAASASCLLASGLDDWIDSPPLGEK